MMYIRGRYNPVLYPGRDSNQPIIFDPSIQSSPDQAILNCKLTMELGKAGTLELVIPYGNVFYEDLDNDAFINLDVWKDGEVLWRGRPLNHKKDFYGLPRQRTPLSFHTSTFTKSSLDKAS